MKGTLFGVPFFDSFSDVMRGGISKILKENDLCPKIKLRKISISLIRTTK